MIALAGIIAERRARQGSSGPGWLRMLTAEEFTCFHEAGHAVLSAALDWHPYELNIDPNGLRVETGQPVLAYCCSGSKPEPPASVEPELFWSDRHTAAAISLVMAGNWKGALRSLRIAKAATTDLIEGNWEKVRRLAWELARCRRLDQAEIKRILQD